MDKDRYYIAICEVIDKHGVAMYVERLSNAWWYTLDLETPTKGRLVKMRECSKEEFFSV